MAEITPQMLANSIMGKIYDVLTNGDKTVPKSENSFFSWCTPGIPVMQEDFQFLTQGFTGVVKKAAVANMRAATEGASAAEGSDSPQPAGLTQEQLDQLRASDTTQLYQQAEALARLVDFVPDVTRIDNDQFAKFAVMNDEGKLSEIYERTLKFSQVMQSSLTEDEKKKLERVRSKLTATTEKEDLISGEKVQVSGPSPLVTAYHEKMSAYENAALEYNARRVDGISGLNPQAVNYWALNAGILRNKVTAAMDDWIGAGHKADYEQIAAFIAQVEGRDLTLLRQTYIDDLEKAKLTGLASGSNFYYCALVPATFYKSTGWTEFTFHSSDYKQHEDSHFKSSGWEAHASGGFFGMGAHGGGSASDSSKSFNGTFESNTFSMKFEIAQVSIVLPWYRPSWMASHTWRFDQHNANLKDQMLSDGGRPPKGLLPAYPTSMILIRNLDLKFGKNAGFSSFLAKAHSDQKGGGASYGWGPISFGGGASHFSKNVDKQSDSGFTHTDEGMRVPGMQIIGFECAVMPMCPNPSPGVTEWV